MIERNYKLKKATSTPKTFLKLISSVPEGTYLEIWHSLYIAVSHIPLIRLMQAQAIILHFILLFAMLAQKLSNLLTTKPTAVNERVENHILFACSPVMAIKPISFY